MRHYKLLENRILFEDNHIIIINKQPSEIIQGDKTGDKPLSEIVKEFLVKKYQKPGKAFLGVVHRLDRPVSGGVIFAKTSKALSRLNNMLREKAIKKTYWAVVKNKPGKHKESLSHFIKKNPKNNKSYISKVPNEGYKKAELSYQLIGSSEHYHLLEVELHTGRHHQIRAQLAFLGCPIKGDLKYGFERSNADASIHLHAYKIRFEHPIKKTNINIYAAPPNEKLWNYFYKNFGRTK
jgi:23S rRNA pseudouridine1911/1915/1917 synthase